MARVRATSGSPASRRITLVADELLGYVRTGGLGTATTYLALALGRVGHEVAVLYVGDRPASPMDSDWSRLYDQAGVHIELLEGRAEVVEPAYFGRMRDVAVTLRSLASDTVIVQDLGAPAYVALRMRQLGLGFEDTLFVVFCHGTRSWITEMARKVRVLPGALAVTLLERSAIELADVAVSPSAYLVDWMRAQGWRTPDSTLVVPYLTRSTAIGEPVPPRSPDQIAKRTERIAFFGRLEERKGIRPFVEGVNSLDSKLLTNVELVFVGRSTPAWTPARIESLLAEPTQDALRRVSFETDLDQAEALSQIDRPGTLAVMPSLGDNSPNTVYECLERGIAFVASNTGGTPELVVPEDRERILFDPTAAGVEGMLKRVLSREQPLVAARPAFDQAWALAAWNELVSMPPAGMHRRNRPNSAHAPPPTSRATSSEPVDRTPDDAAVEAAVDQVTGQGGSRRITFVVDELLGYVRTGGLGTATTFLALALARMGHGVRVLYIGEGEARDVDPYWAAIYERIGMRVEALARDGARVEPSAFARMRDVERALLAAPSDVVIAQDLAAPAYTALRLRCLGLAFDETLFVVHCHGTRRWITDVSRKVRVLPGALALTTLEQESLGLADVVVSPSAYALDWMRKEGWRLPERTLVVPHLTRSAATGDTAPLATRKGRSATRIRRIAFFGRVEERKGIRPFVSALNALGPDHLNGLEVEFVGRMGTEWRSERVEALISTRVRSALRGLRFETDLDQEAALSLLRRPGTLAVMPSYAETFGNTVRECLDNGIPFIASNAGAIPELVHPEDRDRVLFEPTAKGVEAALKRVLTSDIPPEPVRTAVDDAASLQAWSEIVALRPSRARADEQLRDVGVDIVVAHRDSPESISKCLAALRLQTHPSFRVIIVGAGNDGADFDVRGLEHELVDFQSSSLDAAREIGVRTGRSQWVVFLDESDVPEPDFLETLVRSQHASNADVVSCGCYLEDDGARTIRLFAGEPRGLGVLGNDYGAVALIRRSLLSEATPRWPTVDPDWSLLATLSMAGAQIVSVPVPLLTRARRPGAIQHSSSDALLVVEQLERALPDHARSLARLAAGLAASTSSSSQNVHDGSLVHRVRRVLREEGVTAMMRRAGNRLRRRVSPSSR